MPEDPVTLLALGHGAGGSVDAVDLVAVRDAVVSRGVAVALVTQPYRVAGRRSPAPARHLDEAWVAVMAVLRGGRTGLDPGLALMVGGRSSGARVACRTARDVGAVGVVALAFPVHPPGKPDVSRAAELATGLPTLVVSGDRDPFGTPDPATAGDAIDIHVLPGERHDLRRDPARVGAAVVDWLTAHDRAARQE